MEALSLYELNGLVRRAVEEGVSGSYWVQAELAEVRVNAAGHCYVEFVQKSPQGNALLAKARGVIWSNVYQVLRPYFEEETGQAWASGIKVLVRVAVAFHELYGFSLVVYDIDPAYTLGDLAQRRRAILKQLADEGVLTLNKELPMPVLPQRVAVVSSPTAAGYGDFCHQLRHNPYGYYFHVELFAAVMQGEQTEDSILAALDAIHARQDEFDVVVIIRGGGATSDLSGFDTYLLAAACAQFPLPIITGIGHERDDTVLDSVAHVRVKTPTAAAEYLVSCAEQAAEALYALAARLQQGVSAVLRKEQARLETLKRRVPAGAYRCVSQTRLSLLMLRKDLAKGAEAMLARQRHRLELLGQRLEDASPRKLLERGYSLTLKDGRVERDASSLQPGDCIETRLARGTVRSVVSD